MDKKYDFRKTEREMQALWEKEGIYRYRNGREKKVFSIDTPPPTVSGSLHIGHVFSYTQAEMIARFKRMQGYDVFIPSALMIMAFPPNGLWKGTAVSMPRICPEASSVKNAWKPSKAMRRIFGKCGRAWAFL